MEYCGIDLASKASAICVMDEGQKIVFEGMRPTDEDGFRQTLGGFGRLRCDDAKCCATHIAAMNKI